MVFAGFAALLLVVGAIALQWYQHHFPSWDEEVQLSDGRMIIVHRAQKLSTDYALIETALTFDLPEMGGKQTWREFLYPAIVDVYQGKAYVVGHVTYKSDWQYKRPRYGYVAYVYTPQGWQRIPFMSLPEKVRASENIANCATSTTLSSWREKQIGWCNLVGEYVPGAPRIIDIAAQKFNAKKMAELANATSISE